MHGLHCSGPQTNFTLIVQEFLRMNVILNFSFGTAQAFSSSASPQDRATKVVKLNKSFRKSSLKYYIKRSDSYLACNISYKSLSNLTLTQAIEHRFKLLIFFQKHSLHTKKLGFYDVLQNMAFKHCDGVIDVPNHDGDGTISAVKSKLVDAKYCEKFAHVR